MANPHPFDRCTVQYRKQRVPIQVSIRRGSMRANPETPSIERKEVIYTTVECFLGRQVFRQEFLAEVQEAEALRMALQIFEDQLISD